MKQDFYIAGVKFHEAFKVLPKLEVGNELEMEPEPTNRFDSNAVKLMFIDVDLESYMIGYIPAKFSGQASAFLETGEKPICVITEVNVEEKPWKQIKVEVGEFTDLDEEEYTPPDAPKDLG